MVERLDLRQIKSAIEEAIKKEDWLQGAKLLAQWCARKPDDAKGWYYQAYFLTKLGRLAEADSQVKKALSLDPGGKEAKKLESFIKLKSHEASRRKKEKETKKAEVAWQPGRVVEGRYDVKGSAKGGMGEVYFAYDRQLERMVAIKAPLLSSGQAESRIARLYREAEAWIGLGMHPNICSAFYIHEISGAPFLFIEYVEGGTLERWIKSSRYAFKDRLDFAIQIARGMHHTHGFAWIDEYGAKHRGLVHRDLKPANILMKTDGTVKVTDFGLVGLGGEKEGAVPGGSLLHDRDILPDGAAPPPDSVDWEIVADVHWQTITATGAAVGTPPYMAPEQWKAAHLTGFSVDIYAFGCVLYEIFCGRRPFQLDEKFRFAMQAHKVYLWEKLHLEKAPPDPRELNPELDEGLSRLMVRCLSKDPAGRPESFDEIKNALEERYGRITGGAYPRPQTRPSRLVADSLNNQGASFMTIGQSRRALGAWRRALETDRLHLEANFNLALHEWKYFGLGPGEVFNRMEEVGRAHGSLGRYNQLLGELYLFFGEYPKAAAYLREALEQKDASSRVRKDLGLALCAEAVSYEHYPHWGEAEACFRKAMAEGLDDPAVATGLALTLMNQGLTEQSGALYKDAAGRFQEMPMALNDAVRKYLPGQIVLESRSYHGWINFLTFSPDGREVVAGCEDRISSWAVRINAEKDCVPAPGSRGGPGDTKVRIEAPSPIQGLKTARSPRETFLVGRHARAAAVGRLSRIAILGTAEGKLELFRLGVGELLKSFSGHSGEVTALAFSPDEQYILSGGADGFLRLWEIKSGDCQEVFEGHTDRVSCLAFSPDGRLLASGGADGTVRVWDSYSGENLQLFSEHNDYVSAVVFSPDGEHLVSAGYDKTLRLYNLKALRCFHVFEGHSNRVLGAAFHPSGGMLLSCGADKTIRFWSLGRKRQEMVVRLRNRVEFAAVSPDARLAAAVLANSSPSSGKTVCLLEYPYPERARTPYALTAPISSAKTDERESEFLARLEEAKGRLAGKSYYDAVRAVSAARNISGYERDPEALDMWGRTASRFPSSHLKMVWTADRFDDQQGGVTAVLMDPAGRYLVSGGADHSLKLWDLSAGACVRTIEEHSGPIAGLALHGGKGFYVASASLDGTIKLWDQYQGVCVKTLSAGTEGFSALASSHDGRFALAGAVDGALALFDLSRGEVVKRLRGHADAVTAVAFSPEAGYAVSGSADHTVRVWDLQTGRARAVLEGHSKKVSFVSVSPDGSYVFSGGEDGVLCLYEAETLAHPEILRHQSSMAAAGALCPDGRFALTGNEHGMMFVWNLKTGECVRTFQGHQGRVVSIDFSANRQLAVSAGMDKSIRIWQLDWVPHVRSMTPWDDAARPFLEIFLKRQTPYDSSPGVGRKGAPRWNAEQFQDLLNDLAARGFGYLTADGVRKALLEMSGSFKDFFRFLWKALDYFSSIKAGAVLYYLLKHLLILTLKLTPAAIAAFLLINAGFYEQSPLSAIALVVFLALFTLMKKR
ncbi:MAG: protein kinase [Pseudomonadota bacterium]